MVLFRIGTKFEVEASLTALFLKLPYLGALWASLGPRELVWSPWRDLKRSGEV